MPGPFPGMDPYLEHPALWPDVHNSLITAIRDALAPLVAPRYYVALERRTYLLKPDDVVLIGRPDIAVITRAEPGPRPARPTSAATVLEVDVPMADEVAEMFLEVHDPAPPDDLAFQGRRVSVPRRWTCAQRRGAERAVRSGPRFRRWGDAREFPGSPASGSGRGRWS